MNHRTNLLTGLIVVVAIGLAAGITAYIPASPANTTPAPATAAPGGIAFRAGTAEAIFKAARSAGKPVFIEIYSPTCHVCQSFMPTLEDRRVGKFYNDRFVSSRLDVDQKTTRDFLDRQKIYVPSLPLFLYFDAQGNLIHFALSNNAPDEVIRHATNAVDPKARATAMRSRYDAGERAANFLIDYGMFARITRDTVANIRAMNDYARLQPAGSYASQTNWLVLQKLIMDIDNPLAQYMVNNPAQFRQYGIEQARNVAENILMSSLYSSRGGQYAVPKILQIRDQLVRIGIDPRVATNRVLLPEVNAYFRSGQTAKAAARMDTQVNTNPITVPEFVYIARLFNRQSRDGADVPTVTKWLAKGLTLKPSVNEQADLYFELAEAHRRGGKLAEARAAAQKSLTLAQTAKLSTKRNDAQLARLQ
jgi:thiol-disulfide isomerase/thioredoxin